MTEEAFARLIGDRYAPKVAAIHVRDAIVPGQPLVDERVIRPQEVEDTVILAQLTLEKQPRLSLKRLAEIVVELWERLHIRRHCQHIALVQPLRREVVDECRGATVGQHASHLLFQDRRVVQAPARGDIEQLVVRDARPKKKR